MVTETQTKFKVATLRDDSDLEMTFWPEKIRVWPEFIFYDVYANRQWGHIVGVFDELQVYLLNEADQPIAVGHTIPCVWDGSLEDLPVGWADSFVRGTCDYKEGRQPNTLVAIEITIHADYQGQGVSYEMIKAIRSLAEQRQFQALLVPVRPSLKSRYPITPMEQYARWKRKDGTPFDPWLRAHWRHEAEILKIAHPSMIIEASIDQWEQWTKLQFPESGDYVIPDALVPIQIDRVMEVGRYIEPNVWVHHPIMTKRLSRL